MQPVMLVDPPRGMVRATAILLVLTALGSLILWGEFHSDKPDIKVQVLLALGLPFLPLALGFFMRRAWLRGPLVTIDEFVDPLDRPIENPQPPRVSFYGYPGQPIRFNRHDVEGGIVSLEGHELTFFVNLIPSFAGGGLAGRALMKLNRRIIGWDLALRGVRLRYVDPDQERDSESDWLFLSMIMAPRQVDAWKDSISKEIARQAKRPVDEAEALERFEKGPIGSWSSADHGYGPMDIQITFNASGSGGIYEAIPGGALEFRWRPKGSGVIEVTDENETMPWQDLSFEITFANGSPEVVVETEHPIFEGFFIPFDGLSFVGDFGALDS
jgi:hypothetical protein